MTRLETIRRRIASEYCRTILWVDDQIRLDEVDETLSERHRSLFLPTARAIHQKSVICQLQPVSQTGPTGDPDEEPEEISVIKQLAKMADAVILDWHLASQEPKHCVSIIEHLLSESETRFIVILTQHSNVLNEFTTQFDGRFRLHEGLAFSASGQHIAFLAKPETGGETLAEQILTIIYRLIATAYPDYVHWAALEIAANIKKYTPRWLQSLPSDMDWALLSEYCYGKRETAAAIIENLLEDLGHCIQPTQLESTKPDNCTGIDWPKLQHYLEKPHGLEEGDEIKLLRLEDPPPKISQGLPELFANPTNEVVKEFVRSQKVFSTFCENISPKLEPEAGIQPGSVFKATGGAGTREIYVCVSQACDCQRAEKLLFVRGKKEDSTKLGSTIVEFQQIRYRFDAETKNLSSRAIQETDGRRTPEGLQQVGQLRAATARRLAARFWTYTTRAAVNIPAFARAERRGE